MDPQTSQQSYYSPGVKQTATTVFAVILLVIGGIGFSMSVFNFVLVAFKSQAATSLGIPSSTLMIDAILQLVCKLGLLSLGILMLMRKPGALRIAIATLIVSTISTIYTIYAIAPFMAKNVAGKMGQGASSGVYFGMVIVGILAAALYIGVIVYLSTKKTRHEFMEGDPGYRF